jgi:ketosteroid isomerase-like protein
MPEGQKPLSTNLDLVRSMYAAWERGDYHSTAWAHPDAELIFADGPSPGKWTGLDGLAEGWRTWLSAWENFRVEAEEYRELDHERVLVLNYFSAHGKVSGLGIGDMRTLGAGLFHVRLGKVTRLVLYWDSERALADLGTAPQAGSA